MRVVIIMLVLLLFYGGVATLFPDATLAGNLGERFGLGNLRWFGYLGYADLFLLMLPLYRLFRYPYLLRRTDQYAGWMVLFVALILLQALTIDPAAAGIISRATRLALFPYIGQAGMWLLWVMMMVLALVLIVDEHYDFGPILARAAFWRHRFRTPRSSHTAAASEPRPIVSINSLYSRVRAWFHNPFDVRRKQEIDRMLNMHLETDEQTALPARSVEQKHESDASAVNMEEEDEDEMFVFDEQLSQAPASSTPKPSAKRPGTDASSASHASSSRPKNHTVEIVQELEENSRLLDQIDKGAISRPRNFNLPELRFLQKAPKTKRRINEAEIDRKIEELLSKLAQFKVEGDVVRTYTGPLVTTFEFKPAPNVKVSKILGLQDDLAMALSARTIRIQAPIPGRDVVGIEIPNEEVETIYLREILESKLFQKSRSPLTVALGKDIVGNPFIADIKKLPHLLVAGTTGSGKSVGINAMILSLLYRNDPDHLKLMLIDPKMLEFSMYNDIPHLITPVIIEPDKAIAALANMVGEMERRYRLMAANRVKNIENYNDKVKREASAEPFPYIVVVIDELADLMMNGGKEVELSIARLAQKSRACGIHLIVATQRPSVDVVTGLIKANLPSRLSYRVGQKIDSKVILDQMGAESLLGRGDGLFTPPGANGLVRIHAPWSTEEEIDTIVEFLKAQRAPEYDESYLVASGSAGDSEEMGGIVELDPLYEQAKEVILTDKKTSISYLQRKLSVGYNRSANIIEQLEKMGVLTPPNAKGQREIAV